MRDSQVPLPLELTPSGKPTPSGRLGIPAFEVQPLLQQDGFKELVNKFAWVLGSTYRVPYSNVRTPARQFAVELAAFTQQAQGYPAQLAYPKR